jgi:hypothetical protein
MTSQRIRMLIDQIKICSENTRLHTHTRTLLLHFYSEIQFDQTLI